MVSRIFHRNWVAEAKNFPKSGIKYSNSYGFRKCFDPTVRQSLQAHLFLCPKELSPVLTCKIGHYLQPVLAHSWAPVPTMYCLQATAQKIDLYLW